MNKKKLLIIILISIFSGSIFAQSKFTAHDLLSLKNISISQVNNNGNSLIYQEITPRTPNETPGSAHSKYFIIDLKTNISKDIFNNEIKGFAPCFAPNGNISYLKNKDGINQVFIKDINDKETQITNSKTSIISFTWNPNGKAIAYIAPEEISNQQKELNKRGYIFTVVEENIINNKLWIQNIDNNLNATILKQVNNEGNVWNLEFDNEGEQIAFTMSDNNLVDENYMFRKLYIYNISNNNTELLVDNKGKFGDYHFSPNNSRIAYAAALDIYDSAISQAYYIDIPSKSITNITPKNYYGHISWAGFKTEDEIIYLASEGVENKLYSYSIKNSSRKIIIDSKKTKIIFGNPTYTSDFKTVAFIASTPKDTRNIYLWNNKKGFSKITDINPELKNKTLGTQEVIKYKARDGQEIEGIIIKPVNYKENEKYPLMLLVHGGPESHHSNEWLSRYSEPGQVFANKGYIVAYINYGSSTGYGIPFSKRGYADPAAKEFDDLADAIDYICKEKGGDKNRVGMAGGSYGGYASAWFATYYTDYVKASCSFVGISNVISKKGTTDIPYEEIYVHTGKTLDECWEQSLKASPIYYAKNSKTATLICGGDADTRVNPTQSYELFRRMKVNNHPAVRLVQYKGEGHGNRKQVNQIDFCIRLINWMDWYVKDLKPLKGEMPKLDLSDEYGIDW